MSKLVIKKFCDDLRQLYACNMSEQLLIGCLTSIYRAGQLGAVSCWIPVAERLPESGVAVLTQHVDDLYPITGMVLVDSAGAHWYAESEGDEGSMEHNGQLRPLLRAPTHWKELPEGPR